MYHPLDRPISPQKQRIIERANKLRGMLVGSYSQVEYLLGNLWVSMEQVDPYSPSVMNFLTVYRAGSRQSDSYLMFPTDRYFNSVRRLLSCWTRWTPTKGTGA